MATIKKNLSYNVLLNVCSILFPLITAPYVSRVLGPESLGLSSFSGAYCGYFLMFCGLGMGMYNVREFAKRRDSREDSEQFLAEMTTVSVVNCSIIAVLYFTSLFIFDKFHSHLIIFMISGLSIILSPLKVNASYFNGNERFGFITIRSLIFSVATICAVFLFVKSPADLPLFMLFNVISSVGTIFSNIYFLRKDNIKIRLTRRGWVRHYRPCLSLFASGLAISVYTMLDSLMLGFMSSYSQVSYYSYATTVSKSLLALVTSLSAVLLPRMAYYTQHKDYEAINRLLSKSLAIVSFFAFPVSFGLMCVAPVFMPFYLGDAFQAAVRPTIVMAGIILAIGFNNLLGIQLLMGMGLDRQFLISVLVGTVSNFILNLILIPHLASTGAAVASLVAETLILAYQVYYVPRHTPVRFGAVYKDILKSAMIATCFFPIAYSVSRFAHNLEYMVVLIPICVGVYIVGAIVLKPKGYILIIEAIKTRLAHH